MIRFGLRLTFRGGKEGAVRLVITTVAVSLGVAMLLVALAGMNAVNAQDARTAWLNTVPLPGQTLVSGGRTPTGNAQSSSTSKIEPLWWLFTTDYFGTQTIDRVDVAATGPSSPVPPGMTHLPGPGQYYVSPALEQLLRSTPANELGDRFPGHEIGIIGAAGLPSPSSLIIVLGYSPQQLARVPGAVQVRSINTDPNLGGAAGGFKNSELQTILVVGALALLLPILLFIATAARLAAARREQRFAAMRLVGATPRQVDVISTVESVVAAICGVALGFGVFFGIRPALTSVAFTGRPFAPGDLSLGVIDIAAVVIGVPLAAALSARAVMRRVQISPLGVSRRVAPKPLRAYRIAPLLAGFAVLVAIEIAGHPGGDGGQLVAYGAAGLLLLVGLILGGPWVTAVGSRLMVGHAERPATLLAGRRMSDNPRGAFRTISGLIVALFAASASVGVIATVLAYGGTTNAGTAASETLLGIPGLVASDHSTNIPGQTRIGSTFNQVAAPTSLLGELESIPGVRGVTYVYAAPAESQDGSVGLALCSQLARTPVMGTCASGAQVARLSGLTLTSTGANQPTFNGHAWPAANVPLGQLHGLSLRGIVVQTNGSTSALERARTTLDVAFPNQQQSASTFTELDAQSRQLITEVQQITSVVIVVSLIIGGCSLAISVVAGISDRKRPFSLLRLTGVPLRVLREMVLFESAVPLLVVSVLSAGLGFLAAGLFLSSQLNESLQAPPGTYYVLVVVGLVASLAVVAATLPLIERIAGPEVARNE